MRDMLLNKFERACKGMGFSPFVVHGVYVADDGLQVRAVIVPSAMSNNGRIDRRATLAAMSDWRKVCPRIAGRRYAADYTHTQESVRRNEEAPGAVTPRAS